MKTRTVVGLGALACIPCCVGFSPRGAGNFGAESSNIDESTLEKRYAVP